MKLAVPNLCGAVLALSAGGALAAGTVYDEAVDGELSPFFHYPTPITLNVGTTLIKGSTSCVFLAPGTCDMGNGREPMPEWIFDRDFWTVEVPKGYKLRAITVVGHEDSVVNNAGSFFAVAKGTKIRGIDLAHSELLLGATLIGRGGAGVGKNALLYLGWVPLAGPGFDPPVLKSGHYTFWYQEAGGPTSYALRFQTVAVPEAGTLGMMLAGLGAIGLLALRGRRRPAA